MIKFIKSLFGVKDAPVEQVNQPAEVKVDPVSVALDLEPVDLSVPAEPAKKPRKPRTPKDSGKKPAAKKPAKTKKSK